MIESAADRRAAALASAAVALVSILALIPLATLAESSYVDDRAHMLSRDTVDHINAIDETLVRRGGKNVIVITDPESGGPQHFGVERAAAKAHHVTGALISITGGDKTAAIIVSPSVAPLFPNAAVRRIEVDLVSSLKAGQADVGVTQAFDEIADTIAGGASGGHGPAPAREAEAQKRWIGAGADASWIWWILGFVAAVFIIRAVFARRPSAPQGAAR